MLWGRRNKFLTPHDQYLALGSTAEERLQAYRGLFTTEVDEPAWALIRTATQQGVVVGDSRFTEMLEKRLGQKVQPRTRGRQRKNNTTEERITQ